MKLICIFCFVCFLVPFTERFRHTTYLYRFTVVLVREVLNAVGVCPTLRGTDVASKAITFITYVPFYKTTRRHIQESNLSSLRCEDLEYYKILLKSIQNFRRCKLSLFCKFRHIEA
jgi:hypothetical protein